MLLNEVSIMRNTECPENDTEEYISYGAFMNRQDKKGAYEGKNDMLPCL